MAAPSRSPSMRILGPAFLCLVALGTGGRCLSWLGALVVDPTWRDLALTATRALSSAGLIVSGIALILFLKIQRAPRANPVAP